MHRSSSIIYPLALVHRKDICRAKGLCSAARPLVGSATLLSPALA